MKKGDMMKIYFIKYKDILIELNTFSYHVNLLFLQHFSSHRHFISTSYNQLHPQVLYSKALRILRQRAGVTWKIYLRSMSVCNKYLF